jgi:hypothetical protein
MTNCACPYRESPKLKWKPTKAQCITSGMSTLSANATRSMSGTYLHECDRLSYIGVVNNHEGHAQLEIKATCQRTFHTLQEANIMEVMCSNRKSCVPVIILLSFGPV